MKKLIVIALLLYTPFAQATFIPYNPPEGFFAKILRCTWHISCYSTPQFGAFTSLSTSDTISGFPTIYNANLNKTIEVGSTTVASITTLANLSTVGTITSGTWNASTLTVPYGGTGSTTLSQYSVLLGNAAGSISTVNGLGVSGTFLQSQGAGAAPQWIANAIDQAGTYNWTGIQTFVKATTTNATSTSLQVSGLASTSRMIVGALGVGVSTSTQRNAQIGGDLEVDGNVSVTGTCSNCGQKHTVSVMSWGSSTGANGATFFTHTGDTNIVEIVGSSFQYNPAQWPASGVTFRVEAEGGSADGGNRTTIGIATTTSAFIVGSTMSGFTNNGPTIFTTSSTFTQSVMPQTTQTIFCAMQITSSTGQASGCRLVAIISI